jgi:hypothetical protein
MAALLISGKERARLHRIRDRAGERPIDVSTLAASLASLDGNRTYVAQMGEQTAAIPIDFVVTFSFEIGHPGGKSARHLWVSLSRPGRVPAPAAVEMIAAELGFHVPPPGSESWDRTVVAFRDIANGGKAIEVLQWIEGEVPWS